MKDYIWHGAETEKMVKWVAENYYKVLTRDLESENQFDCHCQEERQAKAEQSCGVFYWDKEKDIFVTEEEDQHDDTYARLYCCDTCGAWMIDADW